MDVGPLNDVLPEITRTHSIVSTHAFIASSIKSGIYLFVNQTIRNDDFALYQMKHNDKNEKSKNFILFFFVTKTHNEREMNKKKKRIRNTHTH